MDGGQAHELEEAGYSCRPGREIYGDADPGTLDAMLHLGRTFRDAGELREAEQVLTTLLSMQHRAGEDEDGERILRTEFNLAIVVDRLGSTTRHDDSGSVSWRPPTGRADPTPSYSVRTATNLAITLRKLRRYGDEFPLAGAHRGLEKEDSGVRPPRHRPWRWSVSPRRVATSATTKSPWSLLRGTRRTRAQRRRRAGDPPRRSGPSPRNSWHSSDRRRPPPCSTRS